jgi:raffinose/stachyose/melibiose transport system permease protein
MGTFRYTWRSFARELAFLAGACFFFLPIYILITIALKPNTEIFRSPLSLPSHVTFHNFSAAWNGTDGSQGIAHALVVSLLITGGSILCLIVIGSLCAYVLGRRSGPLTTAMYVLFVVGLVLPFQLGIVPLYVAVHDLGLTGKIVGMIVLYTGLCMPVTVLLYTGFVRTLPREYEEAARVDGAKLLRVYFKIVFPLLRPVTGTVAIFTGLIIWNDFFTQLIFLSGSKNQTLPVTIYSYVGENLSQWNHIFAAVAVAVAPVIGFYILAQRQVIKGFASGIRG